MLRTLALLVALALPGAAIACPAQPLPEAARQLLPADGSQDVALFGAAVVHHVNVARCGAGLAPLAPLPGLNAEATRHSREMAELGFFDHVSPVPGRRTLADRLLPTGVALSRVAENIGQSFMVDYEPGREYRTVDAARCAFTYDAGAGVTDSLGALVGRQAALMPRRTYATAAGALVAGWMASPAHARNILDPAFTRHGAGYAVSERQTLCGRILATQILIR